MTIRTRWPKKMTVRRYRELNYADDGRSQNTVVNDIKQGKLPGVKEGRKWYVYVLPDGSPAYGYSESKPVEPTTAEEAVTLTGNPLADSILAKIAANNGLRVA